MLVLQALISRSDLKDSHQIKINIKRLTRRKKFDRGCVLGSICVQVEIQVFNQGRRTCFGFYLFKSGFVHFNGPYSL